MNPVHSARVLLATLLLSAAAAFAQPPAAPAPAPDPAPKANKAIALSPDELAARKQKAAESTGGADGAVRHAEVHGGRRPRGRFHEAPREGDPRRFLGDVVRSVRCGTAERPRELPEVSRQGLRGGRRHAGERRSEADRHAGGVRRQARGRQKKMLDFAAAKGLPWPHYYDGLHGKTALALKFGVNLIPATFIIDQEGKFVTNSARGPNLEQEIKRLLKL
jgi:hypothetical protein